MADRVEYIKIARIDENGNNLTNTLEALTQITIPYTSGASPAVYPVQSITRYSEYFLYKVGMANRTPDPNDSGSLDYNFTSSLSTSIFSQTKIPPAQVLAPMTIDGEETQIFTNNIILGLSNRPGPVLDGTQVTLNTYPQKPITLGFNFTASITSGAATFKLYKNNGSTLGSSLAQTSVLSLGTHEETLSVTLPTASISPRDGFSLVAHLQGSAGFIFEGSFNSKSHFFASSSAATGPTKETIPEPYLTSRFYGGDCDVLLNNVELYRENPFLQDIDYSTDPNTPVNFDLIVSGIAARGTVPESYYTSLSSVGMKFEGVKVQSKDFNVYNGTKSFPINRPKTYSVTAGVPSEITGGFFQNPNTPFPIDLTLLRKPNIFTANPDWFIYTNRYNAVLTDPPLGVFSIPKRGVPNLISPPNVKINWSGVLTVNGTTGEGKLKVRAGIMKNLNNIFLYDNMQVILESDPIPAGSTFAFDLSGDVFNLGDIFIESNTEAADPNSAISSSYPVIWASLEEHTDNFNPDTASFSSDTRITAEYSFLPENIGTFGKTPSVSSLDANIYEFEWGGGTTPEILDYGAVKMGKILQVSSKDLVKILDPSQNTKTITTPSKRGTTSGRARNYRVVVDNPVGKKYPPFSVPTSSVGNLHFWDTPQNVSDYYQVLNGNNPVNHEISMFMYPNQTAGSNPTLPNATKILTTEWGVPSISNYALTSSNSASASGGIYGTINSSTAFAPRRFISLNRNVHISKVTTDSNGFYNAGQPIKPNWQTIGDQIVKDLNEGERWFVTLYNEFEFPNGQGDYNSVLTTGSLSPFNYGITVDENGNYSNALGYKGVYEIAGVYDNFTSAFNIMLYEDFPDFGGVKNIGGAEVGNSLGMLIWKARAVGKNEFVIVQDSVTGGVQGGAFISKHAPNYLVEDFETITKEYGGNQTG